MVGLSEARATELAGTGVGVSRRCTELGDTMILEVDGNPRFG